MPRVASILIALLISTPVAARAEECTESSRCVPNGDLQDFVKIAREKKCLTTTIPEVTSDGITIIVDRLGRVYGSGIGKRPFEVRVDWCNYKLWIKTDLNLAVAQRVEPVWGLRLRLKATFGLLATEVFRSGIEFHEALDGGLLVEPFYFRWANLNAYLGIRSVGLGLGFDVTRNMTLYAGYGLTWGSWRSSPYLGVGFALW